MNNYKHEKYKQDRQCTYNVTSRRVRETLFLLKSSKYYIFVFTHMRACARAHGSAHACACM
jgi:hypothetical protein